MSDAKTEPRYDAEYFAGMAALEEIDEATHWHFTEGKGFDLALNTPDCNLCEVERQDRADLLIAPTVNQITRD